MNITLLTVTVTLRLLLTQYSASGLGEDVTACALGRTPSVRVNKPQYNVANYVSYSYHQQLM